MHSPYKTLAIETVVHFVIMYAVMYTMVDTLGDFYLNWNNFYMTGMMAAPMVGLMLLTMGHMYKNKRLNLILIVGSFAFLLVMYVFERQQAFIGDKQFVRSMIPHHSGAILMCDKAKITDSELKALCTEIVKAQRSEIEQMRGILNRL